MRGLLTAKTKILRQRIRKKQPLLAKPRIQLPCNNILNCTRGVEIHSFQWKNRPNWNRHQFWNQGALRLVSSQTNPTNNNNVEGTDDKSIADNSDDCEGNVKVIDGGKGLEILQEEGEGKDSQKDRKLQFELKDELEMVEKEESISRFLALPEDYTITEQDAEEIRSCINFLELQVRKKRRSRNSAGKIFQYVDTLEKLLHVLLNEKNASQNLNTDFGEVYVTVQDFNRALCAWRFATVGLQGEGNKDRVDQLLNIQRRNACRSLYASESASSLLSKMEELAQNGYPYLRPNRYSYESVIANWAKASRDLNFVLRGEGKAAGLLRKVPPRSSLIVYDQWDNPTILDKYKLMDPAKKADAILEQLYTMAELDSTEFQVSPSALKQVMMAWIQVKTKPCRFVMRGENKRVDDIRIQKLYGRIEEELKIPVRAEELLWKIVEMVSNDDEYERFDLRSSLFRGVISSWSHSNHREGQHYAEAVLTKMGELYEGGEINIMPTSDIFNAVIGSWARRSPAMPFEAPARCIAILKHMEGISDNVLLTDDSEDRKDLISEKKWSGFSVDYNGYQIAFGAFRSALHCKTLSESEEFFKIAYEADEFLQHVVNRASSGNDAARPRGEIYANVATCYGKAIEVLSTEIQRDDEVLKDAGVDFIGTHDDELENTLSCALKRLKDILEEMEKACELNPDDFNLPIDAYRAGLQAFVSNAAFPEYGRQAILILRRLVKLYGEGYQYTSVSPTSDMFATVIDALLKHSSPENIVEASDLLKIQERLHEEGNPLCKPTINTYRSMLAAYANDPEEVTSLLKRMALLYESNIVDDLKEPSGNTSLGFNEIMEVWSDFDDESDAALWGETMLLRAANDVYKNSSRCQESTRILRTKNFDAVLKAWVEAGEVQRAENLLEDMNRLGNHPLLKDIRPGYMSFHVVMKGWVEDGDYNCGDKADELLRRMIENRRKPKLLTYKLVIEALIKSSRGRRRGIERAEMLLKKIAKISDRNKRGLRPNSLLANMVLEGWSQSIDAEKGKKAYSLLQWMITEYNRKNRYIRPNHQSYNFVKNACVRTSKNATPEEKRNNFNIVLRTFDDLAKANSGLKPSSVSFRVMLEACKRLLPLGEEQQYHTRAIYERCCRMGIVDESIYHAFREIADDDFFNRVIGLDKQAPFSDLPAEWKKNSNYLAR